MFLCHENNPFLLPLLGHITNDCRADCVAEEVQRQIGDGRMNSREKGKRGERQWRDELRANGFMARRGQQFAGGSDSPDVICPALDAAIHFEVKLTEALRLAEAMNQACRDAATKSPILAHRKNNSRWLVTMHSETFFKLLRGEIEISAVENNATQSPPHCATAG